MYVNVMFFLSLNPLNLTVNYMFAIYLFVSNIN